MKLAVSAIALLVGTLACNQEEPPGDETGTTGPDTGGEYDSYYPLIAGSSFTYRHINGQGTVTGLEFVNVTAAEWNGMPAVLMADEPDASGQATESYIIRDGTRALRVHKVVKTNGVVDTIVDYDPGFLRMDDAWTTVNTEGVELAYQRTESDGMGGTPTSEMRSHVYRVLETDVQVTVNAGTFSCIHLRRERSSNRSLEGETVDLWYAKGVGKVKESRDSESDGVSEELLDDYTLGAF